MAANILSNQTGSAYHPKGNNFSMELAYRIKRADWLSIRSGSPSWNAGPAESSISNAEIESQRDAFIKVNGDDGMQIQLD